jgi:hypothetical protein
MSPEFSVDSHCVCATSDRVLTRIPSLYSLHKSGDFRRDLTTWEGHGFQPCRMWSEDDSASAAEGTLLRTTPASAKRTTSPKIVIPTNGRNLLLEDLTDEPWVPARFHDTGRARLPAVPQGCEDDSALAAEGLGPRLPSRQRSEQLPKIVIPTNGRNLLLDDDR